MPPSLSTPTKTAQDPRTGRRLPRALLAWCLLALALPAVTVLADDLPEADVYGFNDAPLPEAMDHPDWFKGDFLDLPEDMSAALAAGKNGLMVYFGQRRCAYCQKLLQVNFGHTGNPAQPGFVFWSPGQQAGHLLQELPHLGDVFIPGGGVVKVNALRVVTV